MTSRLVGSMRFVNLMGVIGCMIGRPKATKSRQHTVRIGHPADCPAAAVPTKSRITRATSAGSSTIGTRPTPGIIVCSDLGAAASIEAP